MAVETQSPFSVVRSLVKKFLGEMRVIRTTSEEQAKARAEEIKSNSLAPGKAQYSVSEVDGIIRNFKDSYVGLLRDIHLMVVTESTSKIRQGIEQGYINAEMITQEMLDELGKLRIEAAKIPGYETKIQDDALKMDELSDQIGNLKAETISLQNELTDVQSVLKSKDQAIGELSERATTVGVDQTIIEARDQVIMDKDRTVHQLSLEKNNLQSEYNRLKIERDAMAQHVEEMETRLRSVSSDALSKEDELFEELQKQLDGSRQTVFNLRNQVAEHEDTVRNQKIDIQQKSSQIDSLKKQIEDIQDQAAGQADDSTQVEELRKQIHQRDEDMERLAENMVELQQDISSKEQEAHKLQTTVDEMMLQFAEKEAELQELRDISEKSTTEREKVEEQMLEKQDSIEDLKARLEESNKELNETKNTLLTMEKQGTISSEEKYQYELDIQKMRKKVDNLNKTLKSVEAFLNTDPKYRVLYLLNDFQRPMAKEELSKMLNVPEEVASKYIFELDYFGYIRQNIDAGKTFIESTALLTPPLSYEDENEEKESE
ncbi:MAG: Chromosome partition protein Smc [Candidatus Heimdallarchaeota archaeon AB_125]|nr:MAG: Chromosome partition protein Smc [Candidatus Heimdallarchaeota archaeon AB_125]